MNINLLIESPRLQWSAAGKHLAVVPAVVLIKEILAWTPRVPASINTAPEPDSGDTGDYGTTGELSVKNLFLLSDCDNVLWLESELK